MQPLIIAGMHRSGTSVLTAILDDLGLFSGRKLEENHEATFFLHLNNWLLRQAGGAWDYPEPFRDFLTYPDLVEARAAQLRHMLTMPRAIEYLGLVPYLRLGDVAALDRPWGWKDPRNTFTLPVWRKIFPGARLLVIRRHGADVASSLEVRARRLRRELTAHPVTRSRWGWRLPVSNNSFCRCLDLEASLALWESYTCEAEKHVRDMGELALAVRYEEFLDDPLRVMTDITLFAGLSPGRAAIETAVERLQREKAFKYREAAPLAALAERHKTSLAAFGY
jgi:hypothetical protein